MQQRGQFPNYKVIKQELNSSEKIRNVISFNHFSHVIIQVMFYSILLETLMAEM